MIIFHNPHVDDLLCKLPYFKLRGRKSISKYGFLSRNLNDDNEPLYAIVDHTVCSFLPHHIYEKLPLILRFFIAEFDFFLWKIFNRDTRISRLPRLKDEYKEHVIISFLWRNLESQNLSQRSCETLNQFKASILHCTHYFLNAKNKGINALKIKNKIFAGDNDFSGNEFFKNIFKMRESDIFITLPFSVDDRFQLKTDFEKRSNNCIATGTIIEISSELNQERHADVLSFFDTNTYHLGRLLLNLKKCKLKNFTIIQSRIRKSKKESSIITNLLNKLDNRQSNYFKLDIVSEYNRYKFAYVGEEITGAAALGNFEAMACGCIMLGKRGFFNGLGLEPSKHFIEIAGDFESFIAEFEQEMINGCPISDYNLSQISKCGAQFVDDHLRSVSTFDNWNQKITNSLT